MIAGFSGAALIIIMFLSWWSIPGAEQIQQGVQQAQDQLGTPFGVSAGDIPTHLNAWEGSSFNDIVWFVTAVVAIGLGLMAMSQTEANLPVATSAIVTALGALSLVLIVIRIIDPPGSFGFDLGRAYGVWLGLIAIIGITAGGWIAMQEEGTSFGDQADRVGGGQPPPPGPSEGGPPPVGGPPADASVAPSEGPPPGGEPGRDFPTRSG